MRQSVASLGRSAFAKNVLVVMTGTAVAQFIGFAISPVISRLFSASDFGVFGSFGAVTGVIAAGVTLEYTQAIMLPKEKSDAANLLCVSWLATLVVTTLCLVVCLVAPIRMSGLVSAPSVWMLALLVAGVLVSGLNQASQAWCVRVKAFKHTSASQVVRSVSANGVQVGLGCVRAGSVGLLVGSVLADLLASLNLMRVVVRDLSELRQGIRWERMKQLAREYRDFPVYSATMNVMNALSQGLPVLLLTQYYGIAVAGAYAFGARILQTPMGFVLRALRQVLFQKACERHNQGGRLLPLYVKGTVGLFALALFPSLVVLVWAPQIFGWVFGTQWHTAGEFARYLVLWMIFMFCNLPSVLFARIIRMQGRTFVFEVILLTARTLVLVLGGIYLPATQTILLFSLVGAIMNVVFIFIVGRALWQKEKSGDQDSIARCLVEA